MPQTPGTFAKRQNETAPRKIAATFAKSTFANARRTRQVAERLCCRGEKNRCLTPPYPGRITGSAAGVMKNKNRKQGASVAFSQPAIGAEYRKQGKYISLQSSKQIAQLPQLPFKEGEAGEKAAALLPSGCPGYDTEKRRAALCFRLQRIAAFFRGFCVSFGKTTAFFRLLSTCAAVIL